VSPPHDSQATGLRERKKAKTRSAIQVHALRLFREHGYDATTVEQIIEAAEVSESTFYRYFPAKADLVLTDEYDPRLMAALRAQPPEVAVIPAARAAFRAVMTGLTAEQAAAEQERVKLVLSVPELRASMLSQFAEGIMLFAEVVAERTGRRADDPAVRALSGAVIGAVMAFMFDAAEQGDFDFVAMTDGALAHLETALAL